MRGWVVLIAAGCGRLGFDEVRDDARSDDFPAVPIPCLTDDFNDGDASDWMVVDPDWTIQAGAGPDGSAAFGIPVSSDSSMVTHPLLYGMLEVDLDLAFRINGVSSADFNLYLIEPGWITVEGGGSRGYDVALYPTTGDDTLDHIAKFVANTAVDLATRPTTVAAMSWHTVHVHRAANNAIQVQLDGVDYLNSAPDADHLGPLDLIVRFYDDGAIDNVRILCTR